MGDEPIAQFTRAKLFQEPGKRTDVAVRFSTVAGGRDSSEAVRDPRGFAVKFYTEDGNWDLVGNNLGVFFIRDAIKFPDFIHSQKPDPVTFERQVPNRVFDFIVQTPESMHMVTLVFGPRGIPASYRTMQGFGVNTYKWVNGDGRDQARQVPLDPEAGRQELDRGRRRGACRAKELGCHTQGPLRGDRPRRVPGVGAARPDDGRPRPPGAGLRPARRHEGRGRRTGSRCSRSAAWCSTATRRTSSPRASRSRSAPACSSTGSTSPTTRCSSGARSPTRDTQRYRVGPNYLQLPVNQPKNGRVATNQRDSQMAYYVDQTAARTRTSTTSRRSPAGCARRPSRRTTSRARSIEGRVTRARIPRTNDYQQAGERYLLSEPWERDDLVANLTTLLGQCDRPIQERMVWHLLMCEDELGAARRRRARDLGRRRPRPPAARRPRRSPRPSWSGRGTSARTRRATSRAR